jgi:Ni,Fe-hydrogenase III large subunit
MLVMSLGWWEVAKPTFLNNVVVKIMAQQNASDYITNITSLQFCSQLMYRLVVSLHQTSALRMQNIPQFPSLGWKDAQN